jgi:zinc D-Ala-D-Ala dipeptidase
MRTVMPALVAGIHVFGYLKEKDVDGRDKPGHDDVNGRVTFALTLVTVSVTYSPRISLMKDALGR